jgi:hypothetical protein
MRRAPEHDPDGFVNSDKGTSVSVSEQRMVCRKLTEEHATPRVNGESEQQNNPKSGLRISWGGYTESTPMMLS